jgi:hypothetical protein
LLWAKENWKYRRCEADVCERADLADHLVSGCIAEEYAKVKDQKRRTKVYVSITI